MLKNKKKNVKGNEQKRNLLSHIKNVFQTKKKKEIIYIEKE